MQKKLFSLVLSFVLVITAIMPTASVVQAASTTPMAETEAGTFYGNKMWSNGASQEDYQIIVNKFVPNKGYENPTEITIPSDFDGHPVVGIGSNGRWDADGYGMFEGMTKLKKVTIPETVTQFMSTPFQGCTSLTTINGIQDDVEYSADKSAFYGTPWYNNLVKKGKNTGVIIGTTVVDLSSCSGDVKIPEGITKVEDDAIATYDIEAQDSVWEPNDNITSLHLPKTLKEFSVYNTLVDGAKIKSFSVAKNNVGGFYSKDGVLFQKMEDYDGQIQVYLAGYPKKKSGTSYTVPAEVDVISFVRGQALKKISFAGDTILSGSRTFEGCKNLTTVNLPKNTTLGPYAFAGTAMTSVTIPANFQDITNSAGTPFTGATTLKTIKVASGCKNYKVSNGALLKKVDGKYTKLICYPAAKSGTTLIIPDGVKEAYTLEESKNLKTIVVPKSMEYIAVSIPVDTLGKIKTIKYKGTKTAWENVYMGGYYTYDSAAFKSQFKMYYNAKPISSAKVTGVKASYTYTGKGIKPTPTVKVSGTKLKKGTHYTVSYKNNTQTGKATITVNAKDASKYYGSTTKTFKIVPKKITGVKTKALGSKKIKVSWKKNSTATGYEIQYSKNKSFKNASKVSVTKNSTVSKTISKLTKNKTYYVRVRAYKTIDGKRAYGAYSAAQTVKVR